MQGEFRCLEGAEGRRDGVKDKDMHLRMMECFREVGFKDEEVDDILKSVSAVAWMSNIEVEEGEEGEGRAKGEAVGKVCELLEIKEGKLRECVQQRTIRANGEEFVKKLTTGETKGAVEGLMKAVYGCVFVDIVWNVNRLLEELGSGDKASTQISVLDIFGFEKFEVNGFEQLCINFCNESLQQQFNAFVFKEEQSLYRQEGIQWRDIHFKDNEEVRGSEE